MPVDRNDFCKQNRVHTLHGSGRWIILAYYQVPSVVMVDLDTGKKENFGLGGLTDDSFSPTDECVNRNTTIIPEEVS